MRLIDELGIPYGVPQINGKPRISSTSYEQDVAEGNVSNHWGWSKMGFNADIQSAEEIVAPQGGTYAFPASKLTMTAVSDSPEDDPSKADLSAGTGAHEITVYYLDDNFLEKSVTKALNGTAAVNLAADMFRTQNVRVTAAGTTGRAVGNITIASGGVTYGYIAAGQSRQRQFVWTVPAGKSIYIKQSAVYAVHTAANKYVVITLRSNYNDKTGAVGTIFTAYAEAVLTGNAIAPLYPMPKKFTEKSDIIVVGKSTGTATVALTLAGLYETA
jgi:hypothetical protein